jgi:hypothetical protein
MACIAGYILMAWINAVALKSHDYPLLYYYIDGRDQVAVVIDGYICIGGIEA